MELTNACTIMSDDAKPSPMRNLTSIDKARSRFTSEDIELTCRKKVEVEITIFHPTGDDGQPIFAENIVSLRFFAMSGGHQEENEWIDWTTLKPLDSIASALAIIQGEEIWSIEAGPSELERQAIRNHSCPRCSGKAMLLTDMETEMEPALDGAGNRQYYCIACRHTFAVDQRGEIVTTVQ